MTELERREKVREMGEKYQEFTRRRGIRGARGLVVLLVVFSVPTVIGLIWRIVSWIFGGP